MFAQPPPATVPDAPRVVALRGASALLGLFVLCAALAPKPAGAQIINTLRGFDRQEMGWSGGLEGAVALASGNTDYTEYELTAAVQRMTQRNRWALLGRFMRRSASGASIAENRMGHLRHNYRFRPWLSSVLFVQGQHDPFRRIDRRILAGGGARFDVLRTDHWEGALGITWMYEEEKLTDDDRGFVADDRWSLFASVYSAEEETVQLDIAAFYQPRVDDLSDARAFAAASARVDITGGLYLLVRYNLVYDTHPPARVETTDQSLRSGLGFEF